MKNRPMTANLFLILATLTAALIAGLFYSYSCSINPGLAHLSNKEYLNAMQSINKAILNPLFFASFMGTFVLLPLATFLQYKFGISRCFIFLGISSFVYLVGVFGVTIFGNVPLNETLATIDLSSLTQNELAQVREKFEKPWLIFHQIRTVASMVSLGLVVVGVVTRCKFA